MSVIFKLIFGSDSNTKSFCNCSRSVELIDGKYNGEISCECLSLSCFNSRFLISTQIQILLETGNAIRDTT